MIDTHCHLNFPELAKDLPAVLARAAEAGVRGYIIPGTGLGTSLSGIRLAHSHTNIWAAIGIHPTDDEEKHDRLALAELADDTQVVAIGEVGLDYFHLPTEVRERKRVKAIQHERFDYFIELAKQKNLPLIIHSRDCFDDMYAAVKEKAAGHPFVIHCFTGNWQEAARWLNLGAHLSFTGIVTYPKNTALREVVAQVPWDRCMLETDAPFLPPQGYRGQKGEPEYVRNVAECIAEVRGVAIDEVDRYTTATAERFFRLK